MVILKNFYSIDELKQHIRDGIPTLFHSSQTSTVIPFEKLENELSKIKGKIKTVLATTEPVGWHPLHLNTFRKLNTNEVLGLSAIQVIDQFFLAI